MLTKVGLYHPYIHFRDDAWMKLAALYWPAMARMVPDGYPTRDSQTIRALRDDLDFVQDLEPDEAAHDAGRLFLELLQTHGEQIGQALAVAPAVAAQPGAPDELAPALGFVHEQELSHALEEELLDLGLAVAGSDVIPHLLPENRRASIDRGSWLVLDARLAAVYMCVLTDELAQLNHLSPVTDQPVAHAAVNGWTAQAVADILLGTNLTGVTDRPSQPERHTTLVAQLALELVMPRDIGEIPVRTVTRFRTRHGDELRAFQAAVAAAADELAVLGDDIDEAVLDRYANGVVDRHFAAPKRDLEAALKANRMETVLTTLNVQTSLPILAGGALGFTVAPTLGVAVAAVVGLGSVSAQTRKSRAAAREEGAAVNYLLSLEKDLRPAGAIRRALASLRT